VIEVKVPDIGDFDEVSVIEVLVKVGDTVKPEQSLVTVESDKASMEIPSSHAGVVKELKVKIGDKVKEGSLVLMIETAGEPAAAPGPAPAAAPGPDRPDVAVAPGRPAGRSRTGVASPRELGNADLTRPIDDGVPRGVNAAAALFAADWLDYLAGKRAASAVRAADPKLLLGFAGSDPNGGIGPGRQGLQGVTCTLGRRGRHLCVADIAGDGGELRFVMAAPAGRPLQATELELE